MDFTRREAGDLLKAWLLVTLAFFALSTSAGYSFSLFTFLIILVVVGGSVIGHELGHKYVAQRYGYRAEFVANDFMLLLGVLMSFVGFIFIAPGAVYVKDIRDTDQHAFIAWAGPAVNIALAVIALGLLFLSGYQNYFTLVVRINAILAGFNLLPVPGFDGEAIWNGDKSLYLATATITGLIVFASFTV